MALVALHPHGATHLLLALVDQRLQHLAFRREPEAVVNQLGITRHDLILEMRGAAVERDRFNAAMGDLPDRTARRFIDTARLHADKAVLDQIEAANAMI